ncbi:MAG: type II toxin-antitoxin system RelE/ParE family toxin [Burkholderiales bacterium]|nr:type II toxin-antitoxin system RelE/ParE family toxin [Burkholderiales bacterium]MDE2297266.1 type II toxin-antitoxin system RelE/ParE family toxin [Burkholderiales bacterium]MDE2627509.1 type II toxin-antitoxin system RelE/ParE family toxin [Burkholderiales bacterium]
MNIRVEEYVRENGDTPYKSWFDRLDVQAASKVTTAKVRLSLGNTGSLKSMSGGLTELRIDWGPGLRVYLAQEGDSLVVLFGGGSKRTQQSDIATARALLAEYKARKAALATPRRTGRRDDQ